MMSLGEKATLVGKFKLKSKMRIEFVYHVTPLRPCLSSCLQTPLKLSAMSSHSHLS